MIIILGSQATDQQIEDVIRRIETLGLQAHLSQGTYRTVIGVIGDEEKIAAAPFEAIPGVVQVVPVLPSFKLASSEAHPLPSIVQVGSAKFGGGHLGMIAGPCAVESV